MTDYHLFKTNKSQVFTPITTNCTGKIQKNKQPIYGKKTKSLQDKKSTFLIIV